MCFRTLWSVFLLLFISQAQALETFRWESVRFIIPEDWQFDQDAETEADWIYRALEKQDADDSAVGIMLSCVLIEERINTSEWLVESTEEMKSLLYRFDFEEVKHRQYGRYAADIIQGKGKLLGFFLETQVTVSAFQSDNTACLVAEQVETHLFQSVESDFKLFEKHFEIINQNSNTPN